MIKALDPHRRRSWVGRDVLFRTGVCFLACVGPALGSLEVASARSLPIESSKATAMEVRADRPTRWVTLGKDPQGPLDDPSGSAVVLPGFDVTAFKARRLGDSVEFRFEFADLGYPSDPLALDGVPLSISATWWLNTERNLDDWFVIADIDVVEERFWVGRVAGLHQDLFDRDWTVDGVYEPAEDFISILVPIDILGGPGTVLSSCRVDPLFGGLCRDLSFAKDDVKVYAHALPHRHGSEPAIPQTWDEESFRDYLTTSRSYKIP